MYTVAYLIEWWTIIYNHASTCFDISNYNSSLLSIHLQFQNATKKMKLKLEIQSDVGSVVTESCTKRGQKGVSFSLISIKCRCVFEIQIYLQDISDLVSKFSSTFFFHSVSLCLAQRICHSSIKYIFLLDQFTCTTCVWFPWPTVIYYIYYWCTKQQFPSAKKLQFTVLKTCASLRLHEINLICWKYCVEKIRTTRFFRQFTSNAVALLALTCHLTLENEVHVYLFHMQILSRHFYIPLFTKDTDSLCRAYDGL